MFLQFYSNTSVKKFFSLLQNAPSDFHNLLYLNKNCFYVFNFWNNSETSSYSELLLNQISFLYQSKEKKVTERLTFK